MPPKLNIALIGVDNTNFPNLALMKLSAYYKKQGCNVSFYDKFKQFYYNKVYASKVFNFTPDFAGGAHVEKGGSGYDLYRKLPEDIEHTCPDYKLYNLDYSLGFTTRGCIRKCDFCIVPQKEGDLKAHADIKEFLRHDKLVLMDNNRMSFVRRKIPIGMIAEINQDFTFLYFLS